MTDDDYRNYYKYVRSTILKNCLTDKVKAHDMIHHPNLVPTLSNVAALEIGTLTHLLLLEPESFEKKIAVVEYTRRGDKRHQDAVSDNPGKIIVKSDTLEQVRTATRKSLASNKIRKLLHNNNNVYERTITANYDGLQLVAQPDIYNPLTKTLIDVKTTGQRIKHTGDWYYICDRLKYICQMVHYSKTLSLMGFPVEKVIFFVQEIKYPYAHKIYTVPDSLLEDGLLQWETAIDIYRELRGMDVYFEEDEGVLESGRSDGGVDMSDFWA